MSLLPECHRWSQRALLALDDTIRGGSEEMHLQAALGISSMYTMGSSEQSHAALTRGLEFAVGRGRWRERGLQVSAGLDLISDQMMREAEQLSVAYSSYRS